ncbi:MAG: MopE-related protein [Myxococcota bacterium]|nr:MopE-related protein [Myxococcota bacterium]
MGTLSCIAGAPVDSCAPGEPSDDDLTCDGVDDDCDGGLDEDFVTVETSCGVGACASTGVVTCAGGVASDSCVIGTPAVADANCDGVDDDCDGTADEDYASLSTSCGTGACASTGATSCVSGAVVDSCTEGTPAASDATCNAVDDDCNGAVDEDFVTSTTSCGAGACASTGATSCVSGAVVDSCAEGTPAASDATCNAVDDDCNGAIDEDFVTSATSCGTGACASTGATSCVSGAVVDSCAEGAPAASDATCNAVDDDCNGAVDEDFVTSATSCGTGACASTGATSCVSGAVVDSCEEGTPAANDASCNDVDDDCNGAVDEDFVTSATSCGTGACAATGATSCVSGAVVDSCSEGTPAASDATCNGVDDDCNGAVDEDFVTSETSCGAGVCASTGTRSCVSGAVVDSCTAGPTTGADDDCDGLDDDCDGGADESFAPIPITCGVGACGASGLRVCSSGALVDLCTPGTPASGDATCDGIDDDCDGFDDEDYGPTSTACGVGACAAAGATSCSGGVEVDSCTPGMPAANDATCDGVDDDCDGSVDEDCVFAIGFCRVQFPTSVTLEAGAETTVYGRLYVAGLTDRSAQNDPNARVIGQLGYGADASTPDDSWTWTTAIPNPGWNGNDAGAPNDDEYQASLVAPSLGVAYDYAYRFSGDGGATWTYCDADAPGNTNGYSTANAGQLTVTGGAVAPTIASLDYTVLAHGARVTITGTDLAAVTDVSIAGTMQMLVDATATSVTVVVPDATTIGAQTLTLTTPGGSATASVTVIHLVISELDSDMVGTDTAEFVEIATGVPGVSLAGYALVLWNGNGDVSYYSVNLNAVTNANGLMLVGNSGVSPTPSFTFANGFLQNGQDAASLHQGAPLANNTPVTNVGLIDALVYDNNTADDAGLLDVLFATADARIQINESQNGTGTTDAIVRCTPERRDGRAFSVRTPPTPGALNTTCP